MVTFFKNEKEKTMMNFKKVATLALLSGFLGVNAGFAMDEKKEEITIGGRTPNQIVHNVVTETNRGVEHVQNAGVNVENTVRDVKNNVKKMFKKKKKK